MLGIEPWRWLMAALWMLPIIATAIWFYWAAVKGKATQSKVAQYSNLTFMFFALQTLNMSPLTTMLLLVGLTAICQIGILKMK